MSRLFRKSQVWAVEYQYDGRSRHWLKALPLGTDAERTVQALLKELYGSHARLVAIRPATELEDEEFRRGRTPRNTYCPTGKAVVRSEPPD